MLWFICHLVTDRMPCTSNVFDLCRMVFAAKMSHMMACLLQEYASSDTGIGLEFAPRCLSMRHGT